MRGRSSGRRRATVAGLLPATLAAVLAGCSGSPDDDPGSALRAVCGEDAEIAELDVSAGNEEESWQEPPLECEVDGHRVEAYSLQLSEGGLASEIVGDQDTFFSGDGGTLGWALTPDADASTGTLVEIFPLDDGAADMSLLDPLEEDGWETGLGYPEE